jgi:hypothetical protein
MKSIVALFSSAHRPLSVRLAVHPAAAVNRPAASGRGNHKRFISALLSALGTLSA